jgi:hypothetical protein
MASFTDQIMQFNPYIKQLPTEAMAKVGMYKQQKYEEGVQKIQSEIDRIAGLDVVRDVDKQYLQSKLNELGGKLKNVAAGDFSNFQLVNSVGGMATQIGKDRNVQNAVSSTAWYRKQSAEMEKAIGEGKSSAENQWDFTSKANEWLQSTDLKRSFSERYTPYVDVKKKAMESIKALHPKLQQYDIPFKMNDDGTINTKEIADAMKRYKIEGISESQIKQAISATLDPTDLNQLAISGRYQFRGVTPEQLVNKSQKEYNFQRDTAMFSLAKLQEQRGVATDPNLIDKIDQDIKEYETMLGMDGVTGTLEKSLRENIELATSNPDQVKANLYKEGFVQEFGNAFSWKNQSVTYETNPLRQQLNWAADMKHKQKEFNRRVYEFDENLKREDEKIRLSAEKNALDKAALYGDPNASDWTPMTNPTDNQLRAQEYFAKHVESVAESVNGDMAKLRTKYSDAQITEMLNDWEENTTKATKVKPNALSLIQNLSRNKNYLSSLEQKEKLLRSQAVAEASKDPAIIAKLKEGQNALSALDKSVPAVQLTMSGKKVTLSPSQLVKDIENGTASVSVDRAVAGKIRLSYLVDGQRHNVELDKGTFGVDKVGGKELRPILLGVNSYLNKFGKTKEDFDKSVEKRYNNMLAPVAQAFVPQIKAVATGKNGEPPPIIVSRLSQLLTSADVNQIAANADFDLTKASEMLLDKNKSDTRVFVYQDGDNFQVHLKSESDPSNRQVLKLSKNDIVRYFGQGYVNENIQESMRVNIGMGNTNLTGDPKKAMVQKQFGDFPGINRLQVTADLNQDLNNPDLYTAMINVKKKDGRYATFEISGSNNLQRVGFDQGKKSLNALTDVTLLNLLKKQYPNYDFSNLDY